MPANALHAGCEKSVLFVASNTNDSLGLSTCRTKVPQELNARINKVHGVPFLPPFFNGGWGGFAWERGFDNLWRRRCWHSPKKTSTLYSTVDLQTLNRKRLSTWRLTNQVGLISLSAPKSVQLSTRNSSPAKVGSPKDYPRRNGWNLVNHVRNSLLTSEVLRIQCSSFNDIICTWAVYKNYKDLPL